MGTGAIRVPASAMLMVALTTAPCGKAQDAPAAATASQVSLIVGHPFSAIKYARRVRVLPDGKFQFVRNERYPTGLARDADGRVMMQALESDDLDPDCNRLELLVPPPCPAWGVFVIDPVSHTMTHWVEGESAHHTAVDFPLAPSRLEEAVEDTSSMPALGPDFSDEDGKMSTTDLGDREVEGIQAHGVRWTLRYISNRNGSAVQRTRIHEVWSSAEMQLIVRVVDGDPRGEETVWGIEKVTLSPDAGLFRPPDGYTMLHQPVDRWSTADFEALKSWFEK